MDDSAALLTDRPAGGIRFPVPGLVFFCTIGLVADCFNFNASLAEIFVAAGRFQATEFQLGVLGAAASLGYMLPCLAAGVLSERVGRRPMVLLALAGLTAVYLRMPYVASLRELWLLAALRAASTTMLWPPLMAWMTETTDPPALPRVLGRYNMSWSVGILLGFALAGWSTERFGYAVPFHLSAAMALALLIFVLFSAPRPMRLPAGGLRSEIPGPSAQLPFSTPESETPSTRHARLWIVRGLMLTLIGCAVQGMVLYLTPKIVGPAVGENAQGMLQVARMGGQIIGFFAFSMTAAWHFRRWPLAASLGCFTAGLLLSAAAAPHATTTTGYMLLGAGFGLIGFAFGIVFTMCSYYTLSLFRKKGLGSGIMETLIGAGGFFGPLLAGAVAARTSSQTALIASLFPLAAAAVLALPWERRRPREQAHSVCRDRNRK